MEKRRWMGSQSAGLPQRSQSLAGRSCHPRSSPRRPQRTRALYTSDGVGNRLTESLGAATDSYTYPLTSNQLSVINLATGGTRGFSYDLAGNVVTEARPGGTYSYTYNAAGRMETFSINGFLQASYTYDAMGRQAIRTLTSPMPVTIHSVFDSDGRRIAEYNETSGALIREYVWSGWEPVAVIEVGQVYFIRADHIARPLFATNASGAKVWSATYLPFGGVHVSTGNLPANRFPGQWFQSESGLHQNWMRDYDPTTGRYLQADPLGLVDGASVYGYAGQSPMMNMDPRGERYTVVPVPPVTTVPYGTARPPTGIPLPGPGQSPMGSWPQYTPPAPAEPPVVDEICDGPCQSAIDRVTAAKDRTKTISSCKGTDGRATLFLKLSIWAEECNARKQRDRLCVSTAPKGKATPEGEAKAQYQACKNVAICMRFIREN